MQRRTFFMTVSAGFFSVAGCTGASTDNDDPYAYEPGSLDQPEEVISDTVTVHQNGFKVWDWSPTESVPIEYNLTVRNGPNIDYVAFEKSEFEHYEDRVRARYISAASDMNTARSHGTAKLPSGQYYFVIDNTSWGDAAPHINEDDNAAEVEYELLAEM